MHHVEMLTGKVRWAFLGKTFHCCFYVIFVFNTHMSYAQL